MNIYASNQEWTKSVMCSLTGRASEKNDMVKNVKATFSPRVLSKNSKLAEVQLIKHFLSEKKSK